jgi:hypothetical protein
MRNGEWVLSPEPIIVADDGMLMNGQHRMIALSHFDQPLRFVMADGVPRVQVFKHLDKCKMRDYSDRLGTDGKPQAIINSIVWMCFPNVRNQPLSVYEKLTAALLRYAEAIVEAAPRGKPGKPFTSAALRAAFALKMAAAPELADIIISWWKIMGRNDFNEMATSLPQPLQALQKSIMAGDYVGLTKADSPSATLHAWFALSDRCKATQVLRLGDAGLDEMLRDFRDTAGRVAGVQCSRVVGRIAPIDGDEA